MNAQYFSKAAPVRFFLIFECEQSSFENHKSKRFLIVTNFICPRM